MNAAVPPPAPDEIRVPLPKQRGAMLVAAAVCLPLGGLAAFSPWMPQEWFEEPTPIGILVLGWFFFLLGVAFLVAAFALARARWFAVSPRGLAYVDPRMPKEEWAFAWPELAFVEVRTAQVRAVRRGLSGMLMRPPHRVRLVLMPMTVADLERCPALRISHGTAGPGTAMAALGDVPRIVPELDAALRRYGGPKYRGVHDEGQVVGRL
ncbi:MAG: hypothetical protein GXX90_02135 [Microbacteriaceae bacterium]|nr:hypothetical protein [Microbacteriaceae bacterium]